jgi:hypothetical protein
MKSNLSRRNFLRISLAGAAGLFLIPARAIPATNEFPETDRLGRACATVEIKARPDPESATVGVLYEDGVLPWLRTITGYKPSYIFSNQKWVETPQGYVYGAYFQPVKNNPNLPLDNLPSSSLGPGMWAEVTVPFADVRLVNDPTPNSWVSTRLQQGQLLRIYYGQVFWVDRILKNDQGKVLYRINPNYYGGLDQLLAPAEAMRAIHPDELIPIHPDNGEKTIRIDINRQTLSCFEGKTEVFHCRVATGAIYDMYGNIVDNWATPIGAHRVTRKYVSLQMSGGTTGAPYDLPGIGWATIFATGGVAIHSTFWHNNFGDPMSHGCVNATPQDAKWIFLWSSPTIAYDPGTEDVTVSGQRSTRVEVVEA